MSKNKETAWKPLKPGDSVALVNPCMNDRNSKTHAAHYKALLEGQWGYHINGLEALEHEKGERLWSGTPEERAQRVIDAIRNPDNKAIFLLVGGDGANETMKLVADWHKNEVREGRKGLPKRGIPVIGLSNNTTLLNPLAQMGIISPVQGKLDAAIPETLHSEKEIQASGTIEARAAKERENIDRTNRNVVTRQNAVALHDLLSGKNPTLELSVEPLNTAAKMYRGEKEPIEIVGGCNFHVIESARTPFQVETKGKYLAVEGPEEQCSVKETLEGLKREGMLDGVKGVFLGYIAGYRHQPNETVEQRDKVKAKQAEVKEAAERLGVPVYGGMPWGHIGPGNEQDVYLPLHTDASLTVKSGKPTLHVSAFRTAENLEQAYVQERPIVANKGVAVDANPVVVSMETMLQNPQHPNLQGKDVVLAFTPKFGEPISHMMGISQSLSALLHKGNLEGVQSLTLDLSGAYDDKDKPLYRKLNGEAINPPHLYNGKPIKETIPDRAAYEKEIQAYLEEFSKQHLGGIPVEVGNNRVVDIVAKQTAIPASRLIDTYKQADGTGRYNASAIAEDYDNGKGRENIKSKALTSIEALALDALDPQLQRASKMMQHVKDSESPNSTPTQEWVKKMQSSTQKGSREI